MGPPEGSGKRTQSTARRGQGVVAEYWPEVAGLLDSAGVARLLAKQRMAAALKANGYRYRYVLSKASGHVDGRVIGHTLPEALQWLWRGYSVE